MAGLFCVDASAASRCVSLSPSPLHRPLVGDALADPPLGHGDNIWRSLPSTGLPTKSSAVSTLTATDCDWLAPFPGSVCVLCLAARAIAASRELLDATSTGFDAPAHAGRSIVCMLLFSCPWRIARSRRRWSLAHLAPDLLARWNRNYWTLEA
ncbi:hypothetical protein K438DRAFT_1981725 [Mycena galopus ATCC 62051]|nr:hypothetical protein K438DRAFT_1981725 [Mycena galopus ATCC 62051]